MTEKEKRELKDGVVSIFKSFNILDHTATIGGLCNDILGYIDSMQEESVSSVWYDARKTIPEDSAKQIICIKEDELAIAAIGKIIRGTVKWAYLDDLLNLSNVERTVKDWKEMPVSDDFDSWYEKEWVPFRHSSYTTKDKLEEAFKAGAKWQKEKDESTTEDLGEYINELSKQFQEVSFAKLSRIAVRVTKWHNEHLWKPADGNNLPIIDREVIALLNNGKVVFAHRPDPKGWDAKSIITEKVEHYTPKTYDKGGWNIPDVKYWLDCSMPKEIEI